MPLRALFFFVLTIAHSFSAHAITIMIDPAGDAQHTGRIIEDTFERAVTLSIAQELKNHFHAHHNCSVILTRSAGETISPLQNANFSNRLPVDLFINLNCYQSPHETLSLYVYYFSYGDPFTTAPPTHHFIPFDKAYLCAADHTKKYAQQITQTLQSSTAHIVTVYGPSALPCTQLRGIMAPALSIELCITHKNEWKACIEPLMLAILKALDS